MAGFEPTASWSRTMRATNCATPGYDAKGVRRLLRCGGTATPDLLIIRDFSCNVNLYFPYLSGIQLLVSTSYLKSSTAQIDRDKETRRTRFSKKWSREFYLPPPYPGATPCGSLYLNGGQSYPHGAGVVPSRF